MTTLAITYFETAMVLLEIGSLRLLTDPVFDSAGTVFDYGPIHLQKTLDGIAPVQLERIDAVLLSHDQHGDNLDRAGRAFLQTAPVVVTTPLAASRLPGVHALGLHSWEQFVLHSPDGLAVTITAVPARHGPEGTEDATGPVTGFILEWPGQGNRPLYISGDTVLFDGTDRIAERYAPVGVAILHLGHVELSPMPGSFLSLSAAEAIRYAGKLQAASVLPIHYEGWRHFTEDAAEASAVIAASGYADRVRWLPAGKRIVLNPGEPKQKNS